MNANSDMSRLVLTAATVFGLACAGSSPSVAPSPETRPAAKPARPGSAVPGFDKRDFPSLAQMQTWYNTSPYEWVAYYLPAPCFSGVAWSGNRQALLDQGWGLTVIYVGLQAPRAPSGATPDTTRCARNKLSAEQGRADGDDAASAAAVEGFPGGTTIYLDVERSDPLPGELEAYVRGWVTQVLARRMTPGIYAHRSNAQALYNVAKAAYAAASDKREPPFWVANSTDFALDKSPTQSGFPFATIWQNPKDASETWGGVTFRIDNNVAASRTP